ncbi:MAG: hypothetical protein HYT27_00635, partial [Parcubacteria group bacterium]|nr:hypothetical protein [Parcubacteria group bacterium]
MNDEINLGGKKYVSVRRFSKSSLYTSDHLSRLCRINKLDCKLFGRVWFVNPDSFDRYQKNFPVRKNGSGKHTESAQTNSSVNPNTKNFGVGVNKNTPQQNLNLSSDILKSNTLKHNVEKPSSPLKRSEIPNTGDISTSNNKKDSWDYFFHEHENLAPVLNQIGKKPSFTNPIVTTESNPATSRTGPTQNWVNITRGVFQRNQKKELRENISVLSSNRLSKPKPKVITPRSYGTLHMFERPLGAEQKQIFGRILPPVQQPQKTFSIHFDGKRMEWGKRLLPITAIGGFSLGIIILLFFIGNALISPSQTPDFISQKNEQETEVVYRKSDESMLSRISKSLLTAKGLLGSLFFKKEVGEQVAQQKDAGGDLQFARERLLSEPEQEIVLPVSTSTQFTPEEVTQILEEEVENLEEKGLAVQTAALQSLTRSDVESIINNILASRFVVGDTVAEEARVTGIVNRIISRSQFTVDNAASLTDLNALENKLRQEIFKVSESSSGGIRIVERQVALTNKIDQLPDVTLINATVSGTFEGLTDAHIPNDITVNGYLPLTGGTLTGALTGTDATFTGTLTVSSTAGTTTLASNVLTTYVPTTAHSFGTWAIGVAGANPLGASVVINPASADSDTNLLALAIDGDVRFLVDAEGDVFTNSLTTVGGVTLATTTASDFTVENTATFGDSTTTDRTYFNSRIGSSLIPTADNLLDIGDTINALAWRTGIFGTSLGVGTTSPAWALSVAGIGSFDDYVRASYVIATSTTASIFTGGFISSASSSITTLHGDNLFASSTIVVDGQSLFALTGGSVGIGTTSPSKRLSVSDEVSDAQVAIAYDATRYAHLQVDSAGDLIIDAQGGDIRFNDENLFVCASGSCPSGTPSAQGSIIAETEIGIGTSSPVAQLGVANNIFIGGGGAPSLGTATSTFEGDIIIL